MRKRLVFYGFCLVFVWAGLGASALAQESPTYSFTGDAGLVTKYIWRGQRRTNDWSVQPAFTLGIRDFSVGMRGNLDLAAVNEGNIDRLLLPENPMAPPNARGMKYRFSQLDYTLAYARAIENVTLDVGTIMYTFPDRAAVLWWSWEVYGGIRFDAAPLTPKATLYIDLDESRRRDDLNNALYFELQAGHSFEMNHPAFHSLGLYGSLGLANSAFSSIHYGPQRSGAHDVRLTVEAPVRIDSHLSAAVFVSYSALVGDFRDFQFRDPRAVHLGTAGSPATYADTVWGGVKFNLGF